MSSATLAIAAPKHSARDDDHALVLPPGQSSAPDPTANPSSGNANAPSTFAAFTRAFAATLAFLFKRPIRLFRPVKSAFRPVSRSFRSSPTHLALRETVSTWAGIQAIAEEQGRSVTPGFVRGLIRKEGVHRSPALARRLPDLTKLGPVQWRFVPRHVLPPLFVNTLIGLTLFTTYTSLLLPRLTSSLSEFLLIPFISGSLAGAAQSLLSAPLDNARLLLLRRQRFLRRAQQNPRTRRHASRGRAGGTAFVGWWALLRDAVFQSSRVAAMGGSALVGARGRLEQGRRWARRGWSLFGLSLAKDSVGFGAFFLIFEVGREGARRLALTFDGIDPFKADDDGTDGEKQRRSPSGLVLQSLGILVSGGVAGWVFSVVARPFERMRGAIWEGRSRWAERDGRLKVIEELALAGGSKAAEDERSREHRRRKRKTSAGGARERRANEDIGPTGRKAFRVRIGRIRHVTRSQPVLKRRKARSKNQQPHSSHLSGATPTSPSPSPLPSESPRPSRPPPTRLPMPSAPSLVRAACLRYGTTTFLFAPRPVLQAVDSQLPSTKAATAPSSVPRPPPPKRPPVGPTRLSARGRNAVEEVAKQAQGGGWRKAAKVLTFIPPYSIGFFIYALLSGDLKIEV
ncbi:SPOSA6832_04792, partial [Sporobolomyces salmonicolor]